jgi:hypothetical protein
MRLNFEGLSSFESGRVITSFRRGKDTFSVVYCRNPHGSHNFVLVIEDGTYPRAIQWGNSIVCHLANWHCFPRKSYRRLLSFCQDRGIDCPPYNPISLRLRTGNRDYRSPLQRRIDKYLVRKRGIEIARMYECAIENIYQGGESCRVSQEV